MSSISYTGSASLEIEIIHPPPNPTGQLTKKSTQRMARISALKLDCEEDLPGSPEQGK